mmetsp:Transcript_17137/g.43846  ORF Transcript_17137/g.43846 Transcript_17137/m.43846 type:complete len:809 (-) Transcript_17137:308-2734(-)
MGGEGLLPSARAMKEFGGLWEGVLGGWHKSVVNSARLVAGDVEEERLVDVIHVSLECRIAHAIQQKSGDHSVELVFKKSAHDKTTMPSSSSHKTAESPNSRSGTDSSTSSTRRSRAEGESFRDGQFNVKEQPERRAAPDYKVSSEVMNPVQRLSASVNFFNFLNDNTLFEAGVISPEAAYANLDTYNYQQQFWVVCDDVAESASNPCVTDVIFDVVQRYFAPDDSTTPLEQNSTVRNSSSLSSFQRQTCLEFFEERGGNGTLGCELNGQPEDSFVYSYNILEDFGNLSGKTLAFVPVVYFSDGRNLQPDFSSYLAQFGPTASAANMKEFYRMPKGPAVAEGQIVMLTISPGIVYYMAPEDTRLNAFLSNTSVPEVEVLSELFWTAENIESKPEAEASLDVQTAATLAEGAILQFTPIGDGFAVSPTNPGDTADILAATDWMLGIMQITDELPNIVSMSFGAPMIPKIAPVIEIIDRLFLMMTALGVTVVASSGDDGSCEGTQGPTVVPEYPGSSSWVLSVGSTQGPALVEGVEEEVVCMAIMGGGISSGGGFNSLGGMPAWQQEKVEAYLQANEGRAAFPVANSTNNFNPNGRGYPDVAFRGNKVPVVLNGKLSYQSGTSYSAPAWASIVAILNAHRNRNGLGNLGFINPFIYWAHDNFASSFNDITRGSNQFGNRDNINFVCDFGYPATIGWDASTGLGTPNVEVLMEAALLYGQPRADACVLNSTHCTCFLEDFLTCAVPSATPGVCAVKRCSGSVCGCDVPVEAATLCVIRDTEFYAFDEEVSALTVDALCTRKDAKEVIPGWAE